MRSDDIETQLSKLRTSLENSFQQWADSGDQKDFEQLFIEVLNISANTAMNGEEVWGKVASRLQQELTIQLHGIALLREGDARAPSLEKVQMRLWGRANLSHTHALALPIRPKYRRKA